MTIIIAILASLLGISVITNILLANLCMSRQKYIDLFKTFYKAGVDIADSKQQRIDAMSEVLEPLIKDDKKIKINN